MSATEISRAAHIKANYILAQLSDGRWMACALHAMGQQHWRYISPDRAEVVRAFRSWWGHFNYADEVQAFNEIFR